MSGARSLEQLSALKRGSSAGGAADVPRPRTRWAVRYGVPLVVVLAAVGLLGYAARDALLSEIEVEVVPVVARWGEQAGGRSGGAGSGGGDAVRSNSIAQQREAVVIAQAPGWIEPDPYAITVQPLVAGVVQEVLVLEGDGVAAGDVVVQLVAKDAELQVRRAGAELDELRAAARRSVAELAAAEAQLAELQDEVERKGKLVAVGGVSAGEFARLEHRFRRQQAAVDAASAMKAHAEAAIARQQIVLEEAELALERTVIRAPVDGVVLSRSVVPGTRIAAAGDGPGEAHYPGVMQLYDPLKLQVRADVPLTDAAKVQVGTKARITTEGAADEVFEGEVTRVIHLADIQRNSVRVKVRIDDPSPLLKPDMLCRVRFLSSVDEVSGDPARTEITPVTGGNGSGQAEGSLRVYAVAGAIQDQREGRGWVWVVEPGPRGRGHVAQLRDVVLGPRDGELVLVMSGLRPGDRVIVSPVELLEEGARVRIGRGLEEVSDDEGGE